jgi:hypothetical protein
MTEVFIPFRYDYGESYRQEVNGEYIAFLNEEEANKFADEENKKSSSDGTKVIIRKWTLK